jgi:hypothetical protein
MTAGGFKRHRFAGVWCSPRAVEAIELAVEGENPPAGARAEIDPELLERGMNPKLPQFGVLLKLPYVADYVESLVKGMNALDADNCGSRSADRAAPSVLLVLAARSGMTGN